MLKNYLLIAVRNLRKHKGYAFVNLSGFALGIACCILIVLFVQDELSYDRFHEQADQIYRVAVREVTPTSDALYPLTPYPLAATLVTDFPDVIHATRLRRRFAEAVGYGDKLFDETRIHRADSNFFEVFQLRFLQGHPKTALKNPSSVVITASIARKYFGDDDPMGNVLDFKDGITYSTPYTVTGVIEDVPRQSHFDFDFLLSWRRLGDERRVRQSWFGYGVYTYFVLDAQRRPEDLEAKFPDMLRRYGGPQIEESRGLSFDEHLAAGNDYHYFLQPLTDIHLHSNMGWEIEPNGSITYVYLFMVIAFFILLLACVNYMNLATARSARRASEIGMRKVMGSNRRQLIAQILTESVLMTGLAFVVALVLVEGMKPAFNAFTGKALEVGYFSTGYVVPALLGGVLVIGILAGSYPAFFLSAFRPVVVLKGTGRSGASRTALRNSLVVFQFVVSMALLVGTFVVQGQMDFMLNKKLGFEKEHVVVMEKAWALGEQRAAFKQEVQNHPGVVGFSAAGSVPGGSYAEVFLAPGDAARSEQHNVSVVWADHDYVQTLGLAIAQGRSFDEYVVVPALLGGVLVIGILAGSYPAFFLSAFRPVVVLKGTGRSGASRTALRNSLVVFQFVVSMALLVGTFVVQGQMDFMLNKKLGFEKEHVVVMEKAWALGEQRAAFKQEVQNHPGVVGFSAAGSVPGGSYAEVFLAPGDAARSEQHNVSVVWADHDYVQTLGLAIAQGRSFDEALASDSMAVVVNEALVRVMGFGDRPLEQHIRTPSGHTLYPIIGVVTDFHFQSLHEEIQPFAYFIAEGTTGRAAVRIRSDGVPATLAYLEQTWETFVPDKPFSYSFLEDDIAALYRAEEQTRTLFGIFSLLAIVIACLGLFGLSAFIAEQRTKEMGIRKVLGASVGGLVLLLSKDFVKLVGLAFVVATPMAYFAMHRWLESFAYRTEISWWIFLVAGLLALAIALLTVGYQAVRAALADPVRSLRYE